MPVAPGPDGTQPDPRDGDRGHQSPAHRGLPVLAWGGAALAVVAGVGWLYLLRGVTVLDLGPKVAGALPLEQLAGKATQPLLRLVVAWVPAGLVAGVALRRGTALPLAARAALLALLAWAMLVVAGAASDAVAVSASVQSHLPGQLTRAGTWTAVGLMTLGGLLSEGRRARWAGRTPAR